ncbi:MAG: hypothetical protein PF495_07630, partial [Spirochaetales bacterium]|nr:hypothetical protein [Spirochaetales bacterium]
VKDSVLFFNTIVGKNSQLEKVISDVNVTIGDSARIGTPGPVANKEVTLLGWNNFFPDHIEIGSNCTIYPQLAPEKIQSTIPTGEVVR